MSHFEESKNLHDYVKKYSFATIISHFNQSSVATHIPLLLDTDEVGQYFLRGHIMKNTDHHEAFEKNKNVLVIFQGPNCYVSSSWYDDKGHASTWNYIAIHIQGELHFMSEKETHKLLVDLTKEFEQHQEEPIYVQNMDERYVSNNLKAIVGFQIKINDIKGTFKLSQNQTRKTQENIIEKLMKSNAFGAKDVANEMKKRLI